MIDATAGSPSRLADFGMRARCWRRSSAKNKSISFSSRGFEHIPMRESVTPAIADTTTNARLESSLRIPAIRSYMSRELTQFPPNFATVHGSAKVPSPVRQFGVQYAPARTAAERVVLEDEEPQHPIDYTDPSDRRSHPARPRRFTRHEVEEGLWPVCFRANENRSVRCRWQLFPLRLASERG